MPRATVDLTPQRHELRTCPEGYVVLRKMSYGDKQHRMEIAMELKGATDREVSIKAMQQAVTQFEFRKCIVEHNLEDEEGTLLDLHKPADIDKLDPRIGDEIDSLISEMNNWEAEDLGN